MGIGLFPVEIGPRMGIGVDGNVVAVGLDQVMDAEEQFT